MLFFSAIPFVVWQGDAIQTQNTVKVAFQVYLLAILYVYLTFFWTKSGQTPGLKTWKLQLIDQQGYVPSRYRANIRFLFSILLFWIGWIGLFFGQRQTLQDQLSGTQIISIKQPPK